MTVLEGTCKNTSLFTTERMSIRAIDVCILPGVQHMHVNHWDATMASEVLSSM